VRALSKHARKSAKRDEHRTRYYAYMGSDAWRAVRAGWLEEYRVRFVGEPACAVCEKEWQLSRDDLHHHTYARLGAEAFEDLAPLCRSCHSSVHDTIRGSRHWSRMRDVAASIKVIQRLRLLLRNDVGHRHQRTRAS